MTAGRASEAHADPAPKVSWLPLVALAIAQFVMVLDQSAMNVSISALVDDFVVPGLTTVSSQGVKP